MKRINKQTKFFLYCISLILVILTIAGGISFMCISQFAYASTDLNEYVEVKEHLQEFSDIKYIPNKDYFLVNPLHHSNKPWDSSNGLCTTVALQMLLGYHNYYSDRRLIPPVSNDGIRFLSEDYGDLAQHPNVNKTLAAKTGLGAIGTQDTVFDEIVRLSTLSGIDLDQMLPFATDGANNFLEKYSNAAVNASLEYAAYSKESVLSELDAGKPVVLGMRGFSSEGKPYFHVVVIYGYALHNREFGYVGHWGWEAGSVQIWGPERWFSYQVTMNVEHTHNYVDCVDEEDYLGAYRKLECSICGCTTLESLYATNEAGNEIVGYNYALKNNLVLPNTINGVEITSIGTEAFANSTITDIVLPEGVTNIGDGAFAGSRISNVKMPSGLVSIGDGAFENCVELENIGYASIKRIGERAFYNCGKLGSNIYLESELAEIGNRAFEGCNELSFSIDPYSPNPNYYASGNVLYTKDRSIILASGKVNSTVIIPDSVNEIASYAFANNDNVQTVKFGNNMPTICESAFADCRNLSSVYLYSFDTPEMSVISPRAFANDELILYVPYICRDYYENASFEGVTVNSVVTVINFVSDGELEVQEEVYYGAYLEELPTPSKTGYNFVGWYGDADMQGAQVCQGDLWSERDGGTLYAGWSPKSYVISFAGEQSEGLENKTVVYDSPVGELPVLEREGYTFLGWKGSDGLIYNADTEYTEDGDLQLESTWQANVYTITFNGNGGTPSTDTQTATYDDMVLSLATCERRGYTFTGWNTLPDGSGETVTAPFTYLTAADVTLYAQWDAVRYGILYNLNGGTQAESNPDTYTIEDNVVLQNPSKAGYTFVAWKRGNEVVIGISGEECCNIQLDAEWQANTYEVTFDVNGGNPQIDNINVTYGESFTLDIIPTKIGNVF